MGTRNADTKQGDTGSSAPSIDRSKTGNRDSGASSAPPVDQIRSRARDTGVSSPVDHIRSKDGNKDTGSPSAPPIDQIRSKAGNKDTGSPSAPPVDKIRSKAGNKDTGSPSAPPSDPIRSRAGNAVLKSGSLFISSKGIGWTSWKKRWFILTRTSLVFFRSDPSVNPQKGSEVNLTLGGIDLNSSGSVVVKEDKKLLTVLFPNGRDGRTFTLKAETTEDLYDWKTALENALAQAPSAALVMGQNGIFRNDPSETVDGGFEQLTDRQPVKSSVIGRPILLALEDIDGTPSFLEKALAFIEQHGVKVEGILRQSADVDDVNRRVREYEEGKVDFSAEEDAHIIADCVKHVIRELPSSPVPASCCKALLEACRADRGGRINAMRAAIAETFPEPNRLLLQRILKMMQIVASHKSENRMSSSAVSACMAPLLLRPLMEGDCELENDFSLGDDNSLQLLQAAAAANHAQAIVITLLEEYDKIFGDDTLQEEPLSPEVYSDSEESGSENDELTDEDEILDDEDGTLEEEDTDRSRSDDADTEDEDASSGTISESSCTVDDQYDTKVSEDSNSGIGSAGGSGDFEANQMTSGRTQTQNDDLQSNGSLKSHCNTSSSVHTSESHESVDVPASRNLAHEETDQRNSSFNKKSTCNLDEPVDRRLTVWGRAPAKKISMESIDCDKKDEIEVQTLELAKADLQNKIAREVKENAALRASLENRRKTLHERRLTLQQEVFELQEKLQKERDLRLSMESQLNKPPGSSTLSPSIDNKTKAEQKVISQAEESATNLNKKVENIPLQLNQQSKNHHGSVCGSCGQPQPREHHLELQDQEGKPDSHDRSRSGEDTLRKVDSGNVRRDETPTLPRKQSAEKQQMALIVYEGAKYGRGAAPPSSGEPMTVAPNPSSSSKKSGTKGEGNMATSSGLSKLTTRLNFLKERRSQIVNELQNIEKSRGPDFPLTPVPPKTKPR